MRYIKIFTIFVFAILFGCLIYSNHQTVNAAAETEYIWVLSSDGKFTETHEYGTILDPYYLYSFGYMSEYQAIENYTVSYTDLEDQLVNEVVSEEELWPYIDTNCNGINSIQIIPNQVDKYVVYCIPTSADNLEFVPLEDTKVELYDFITLESSNISEELYFVEGYFFDDKLEYQISNYQIALDNFLHGSVEVENRIYVVCDVAPRYVNYTITRDNLFVTNKVVSYSFYDYRFEIDYEEIFTSILGTDYDYYKNCLSFLVNGVNTTNYTSVDVSELTDITCEVSLYSNAYLHLKNLYFRNDNIITNTYENVDFATLYHADMTTYYTGSSYCSLTTRQYRINNIVLVDSFKDVYDYFVKNTVKYLNYNIYIDVVDIHDDYYFGSSVIYKSSRSILIEPVLKNMLSKSIVSCIHSENYEFENISYIGNAATPGSYEYKLYFPDYDKEYIIKIIVLSNLKSDYIYGNQIYYPVNYQLTDSDLVADLKIIGAIPNTNLSVSLTTDRTTASKYSFGNLPEGSYQYDIEYYSTSGLSGNYLTRINVLSAANYDVVDDTASCNAIVIIDYLLVILFVLLISLFVIWLFKKIKKKKW